MQAENSQGAKLIFGGFDIWLQEQDDLALHCRTPRIHVHDVAVVILMQCSAISCNERTAQNTDVIPSFCGASRPAVV